MTMPGIESRKTCSEYIERLKVVWLALFIAILSFVALVPVGTRAATISSSPTNSLTQGIVGWWTFDGKDVVNGVAKDISGNGFDGNLINIATSTFYKPGKIGQGFNFDGVDDRIPTIFNLTVLLPLV